MKDRRIDISKKKKNGKQHVTLNGPAPYVQQDDIK